MARFTVFGSNGFIGRHLVRQLRKNGHEVDAATRASMPTAGRDIGHAVFCIGITANFRSDPAGTVEAQVIALSEVLKNYRTESLLYPSSTRVYDGVQDTKEDTALLARPSLDHLYNLTKLTGEAMVLAQADPGFRVVRLSNVIGPGEKPVMFLPSVSDEARRTGKVLFRTAPESEKDYVAVEDAVAVMEKIALAGKQRLYNVASGRNTTNAEIAELVRKYFAADTAFAPNAPAVSFPPIDIGRAASEFNFSPRPFAHAYARALESEDIA